MLRPTAVGSVALLQRPPAEEDAGMALAMVEMLANAAGEEAVGVADPVGRGSCADGPQCSSRAQRGACLQGGCVHSWG